MTVLLPTDPVAPLQTDMQHLQQLAGQTVRFEQNIQHLSTTKDELALKLKALAAKMIVDEQHRAAKTLLSSPLKQLLDNQYLPGFRLALLSDEFTYLSLQPECLVLALDANSWQQQLEEFKPQLVLVESAWAGVNGSWAKKLSACSPEIQQLAEYCQQQQIKTAFWNKEDPVHYDTFLATASLFDVVFTTDEACISQYKAELGHNNVFLLPFACQPTQHHPILIAERKNAVCFAGAYYPRYPERCNDFERIIVGLSNWLAVTIFDRNAGDAKSPYAFPKQFEPFIKGNVPYEDISKIYKGFEYSLNFNSVKNSPSMFARRVPELLACGSQVLSNESAALRRFFGKLIAISDEPEALIQQVNNIATQRAAIQQLAIRKVMTEHSWQQRLSYLIKQTYGVDYNAMVPIVVLAQVQHLHDLTWLLECFTGQDYNKAVLLLIKDENLDVAFELPDNVLLIPKVQASTLTLRSFCLLNSWVALWHPADYYGPAYLSDMQLCCSFAPGDVIAHHHVAKNNNGQIEFVATTPAYTLQHDYIWRSALVASGAVDINMSLNDAVQQIDKLNTSAVVLNMPPFEYVRDAAYAGKPKAFWQQQVVLSELQVDCGKPIDVILAEAHAQPAALLIKNKPLPAISAADLATFLAANVKRDLCQLELTADSVSVNSDLPADKHAYWYCQKPFSPAQLNFDASSTITARLDSRGALDLWLVFIFKDKQGQKISHHMQGARLYRQVVLPEGTEQIELALRWVGAGSATIHKIDLARPEYETQHKVVSC